MGRWPMQWQLVNIANFIQEKYYLLDKWVGATMLYKTNTDVSQVIRWRAYCPTDPMLEGWLESWLEWLLSKTLVSWLTTRTRWDKLELWIYFLLTKYSERHGYGDRRGWLWKRVSLSAALCFYDDQPASRRKDHEHSRLGFKKEKLRGCFFADSTCPRSKNPMSQLDSFLNLDKQKQRTYPLIPSFPIGSFRRWNLKLSALWVKSMGMDFRAL